MFESYATSVAIFAVSYRLVSYTTTGVTVVNRNDEHAQLTSEDATGYRCRSVKNTRSCSAHTYELHELARNLQDRCWTCANGCRVGGDNDAKCKSTS